MSPKTDNVPPMKDPKAEIPKQDPLCRGGPSGNHPDK